MSSSAGHRTVTIEQYEYPILAKFLEAELNKTATDLAQPSYYAAFRRSPKPEIMPDVGSSETDVTNAKAQLAWSWIMTLVQIDYAFLYTGTPESASLFEQATGVSPAKFAQGFLEADGSIWRYFRLKTLSSRKFLRDAMLELWSESVKKWRVVGKGVARDSVKQRFGANAFQNNTNLIEQELGCIAIMTPDRRHQACLLKALEPKGHFDCDAHPMRPFCGCPVALDTCVMSEINTKVNVLRFLDTMLLNNDDAFLYVGDIASSTLFRVRSGQAPELYIRDILTTQSGVMQYFKPAISELDLIKAGLQYWAAKVKLWRSRCKTRREARTREREELVRQGQMQIISTVTGQSRTAGPDDSQDDPLLRKIRFGATGHVSTAVCYARWDEESGLGYEVLHVWPCHSQCAEASIRVPVSELMRLASPHKAGDTARARAVVAEW